MELGDMLQVRSVRDLQDLVKHHQIESGGKPLQLNICGAERLAYEVTIDFGGYEVRQLDGSTQSPVRLVALGDMPAHPLGLAVSDGMLFIVPEPPTLAPTQCKAHPALH